MSEKINIKEVIKVAVILFLITALSAGILGFINSVTAPLIRENNIKTEQSALAAVLPDCVFEEISDTADYDELTDGNGSIIKIYKATDENGNAKGVCVITETTGYDVGIQTVTGVSSDLSVTGIEIISMNETPGLGANAKEQSFRQQYIGKSYPVGVSKTSETENDIQAISGATKTSNGVTNGVNIALKVSAKILEGGNE